jgi:hypothetical protein
VQDAGAVKTRLALLIPISLLIGLSACAPSVESFVEARRDWAVARIAKVLEARDHAKSAPDVFEDTMADPGAMSLCDLMIPPFRDKPCDTWAIALAQLDSPNRYLDEPTVSFGQAEWLVLTKSLLETGRYPPNDKYPEGAVPDRVIRTIEHGFRWLQNLKYLLIVDPDELVVPDVTPDQKAYIAGNFEGVAHLYAIEPNVRPLGSVRFTFAMSGDVKVRMRRGQINKLELNEAFTKAVREALASKLGERLRSLEPPPP